MDTVVMSMGKYQTLKWTLVWKRLRMQPEKKTSDNFFCGLAANSKVPRKLLSLQMNGLISRQLLSKIQKYNVL